MDNLLPFQSLRATMERCSEIVTTSYSFKPEELYQFEGELPPGHNSGHRRHRYWVTEVGGDMVVALPGTTHPLDWSSNMRVHYTPIDGTHPPAGTPTEQLEKVPCAHAGFYFRAETIPTLALLEQAAAKGLRLVLTGHSLGGAVANMCTLTALQAQKKAREAAAKAATAKREAAAAAAAAEAAAKAADAAATGACQQQHQQQQQRKKKVSPFQAAASAAAVASAEAHTNHSWCSANSDVLVSPQAALVEVLCVAFASPLWANQALTDYIDGNDWGEVFVNVMVPEDYCLKLFNNVLTSANPAERHTLSRSNSSASLTHSGSNNRLADEDADCCPDPLLAAAYQGAEGPPAASSSLGSEQYSSSSDGSTATTSSSDTSTGEGRLGHLPGGGQQPLVSALAGTRRKHKKKQLSFVLPDQQAADCQPVGVHAAAAAAGDTPTDTPAAAAAAAAAADSTSQLEARRPAPMSVGCSERIPSLYAAAAAGSAGASAAPGDTGSWSELQSALPTSPSCASLSSLSSLNSTRSWTLLAYLPDVLIRSFSNGTANTGLEESSRLSSTGGSSDGGCSSGDDAADAIAAMFAGVGPNPPAAFAAPPATPAVSAAFDDAERRGSSSGDASSSNSGSMGGWPSGGMRHAKSSIDLSVCSLTDGISVDDSAAVASAVPRRPPQVPRPLLSKKEPLALKQPLMQQVMQQQVVMQQPSRARVGLRRSVTSASLRELLAQHAQSPSKLLAPLKLTSSLALAGTLLPSLRSVALASRAVMKTASSIKEAAFNIPLTAFELYLIKTLKPPMYKPVGQQWILSATGLVMQQHPIHMYPKHVHDVFWHKELALVAFREHSIVFYKQRLMQQASRR